MKSNRLIIIGWVLFIIFILSSIPLMAFSLGLKEDDFEEKEFPEVSLEQEFADNHIIVVMNKQSGYINKEVDCHLFSSIGYSKND